jgi:hypothetical protein
MRDRWNQAGIDLAAAVEQPQRGRARCGRPSASSTSSGGEPGHVDHTAVNLLERPDYVE